MDTRDTRLSKVEQGLRTGQGVSQEALFEAFSSLSHDEQAAFARAFIFLGCQDIHISPVKAKWIADENVRIQAVRLMLLKLHVGLGEPLWSSYLIDQMWASVLETPGGQFTDLYKALSSLLAESSGELTLMLARFIQAVTLNARIQFFAEYRSRYLDNDFSWMLEKAKTGLNAWEAYLLMYALPRENLSVEVSSAVLKGLAGTEFEKEVLQMVGE
jgi:hypothetical protein